MTENDPQKLIQLLQRAYSGELAAANAYRGHWQSVRDPQEKAAIFQIEIDELLHRQCVGKMLIQLGAAPRPWLEFKMNLIGKTIGLLCHFGGWFMPMYGAGRLERDNIDEYIHAADYANRCGCPEMIPDLLHMAELEWEHERYFREKINSHWLSGWFPSWPNPGPKSDLRFLASPPMPPWQEQPN